MAPKRKAATTAASDEKKQTPKKQKAGKVEVVDSPVDVKSTKSQRVAKEANDVPPLVGTQRRGQAPPVSPVRRASPSAKKMPAVSASSSAATSAVPPTKSASRRVLAPTAPAADSVADQSQPATVVDYEEEEQSVVDEWFVTVSASATTLSPVFLSVSMLCYLLGLLAQQVLGYPSDDQLVLRIGGVGTIYLVVFILAMGLNVILGLPLILSFRLLWSGLFGSLTPHSHRTSSPLSLLCSSSLLSPLSSVSVYTSRTPLITLFPAPTT